MQNHHEVFVWAAQCHGDLVGKLAPAGALLARNLALVLLCLDILHPIEGRRVAGAAHRTLSQASGQRVDDSMLAKLALLEALVVRA